MTRIFTPRALLALALAALALPVALAGCSSNEKITRLCRLKRPWASSIEPAMVASDAMEPVSPSWSRRVSARG